MSLLCSNTQPYLVRSNNVHGCRGLQNLAFRRGLLVQEDLEVYDKAPLKKTRGFDGTTEPQTNKTLSSVIRRRRQA